MRRRPPPTPPKLRRSISTVAPEPLLLVLCEGRTEERILGQLRAHWRIPGLHVRVTGGLGEPRNVVRVARDRKREDASHGLEVWVVFDRDEHPHWSSAIDRARSLGVELAISNPCFELWALLLHRDQTAHIHRHDAQRLLKSLHGGYDHARSPYLDVTVVLGGLGEAERRCAQLRTLCLADGDPHGNPSSSFSDLVARIKACATA